MKKIAVLHQTSWSDVQTLLKNTMTVGNLIEKLQDKFDKDTPVVIDDNFSKQAIFALSKQEINDEIVIKYAIYNVIMEDIDDIYAKGLLLTDLELAEAKCKHPSIKTTKVQFDDNKVFKGDNFRYSMDMNGKVIED